MRLSGERGIGTIINYADTLKGSQTDTTARVDAYFRFNPRHSIGFTCIGSGGMDSMQSIARLILAM